MYSTLSGSDTDSSVLLSLNALLPILLTIRPSAFLVGITIFVSVPVYPVTVQVPSLLFEKVNASTLLIWTTAVSETNVFPDASVILQRYIRPSKDSVKVKEKVSVLYPADLQFFQVLPPFVLYCH